MMIDPKQLESHKQIVKAYADSFSKGDLEAVCKLFAEDAIIHGVLGWGGLDQARPIWEQLVHAFAMKLEIQEIVGEGNSIVARFVERGTFLQPFRGIPPTGKSYEVLAMEWFEFADGKISRRWGARDSSAIDRQLGIGNSEYPQ